MEELNLIPAEFWDRLKQLMKSRKVTQQQMCSDLNIDVQQFRNKKFACVYPTTVQLLYIARYFGTSVEYLMLGDSSVPNPLQKRVAELEDRLSRISSILQNASI